MKTVFTYWLLAFALTSFAQGDIAVGTWRVHLSYNDIRHLGVTDEKIFAAGSNGILVFDRAEASLKTIDKSHGLSSTGITALAYDVQTSALLAGYTDGSLDIITGNIVSNFYRLREADITTLRDINHITTLNGLAYLSTAYGVVVFDIAQKQIKETWRDLGSSGESLAVNGTTISGDSIFLATVNGVLAGNLGKNLLDFNNWKRFDADAFANPITHIATFNNTIYASGMTGVYRYANGAWSEPILETVNVTSLSSSDDKLLIIGDNKIYTVDGNGVQSQVSDPLIGSPADIQQDDAGNFWIGDQSSGLLSNASGNFSAYLPNGPSHASTFKLISNAGRLFAVGGGFNASGQPLTSSGTINIFENGQWRSINQPVDNITGIAFQDDQMFTSSFGGGIAITDGQGNISLLNENNSPIDDAAGNEPKVTAMKPATAGLWVALYQGVKPLHLLKADGSWASFSFGMPNEDKITDMAVDGRENVWLGLNSATGGGLIAYDAQQDQAFFKSTATGQGALPHKNVNSIAIDREGYTWIGTDAGVAYFFGPSQDALKPIYENRFLLRDEKITAIEVDGGNRKWIGTTRGVWLFNDSGEVLIHHFTTENSLLLSDHIRDIEIDDQSGEVFISTEGGLVSYRSDATKGTPGFGSVKIFPNPVHPGYSGLVGISGLANDAEVRITDINGRLLWHARANGGTASWNLRDQRGNRARTGVYLVFAIAQDGRESVVGKIAVIE